jgi:L-alanine-DL-glutamate epimerase-like enolase superfamily enzyme
MTATVEVRPQSHTPTSDDRQRGVDTPVEKILVSAYKIPTDATESDGTYRWTSTTLIIVETLAGNTRGLGYTYANVATAELIRESLIEVVRGRDAMDVPAIWAGMVHAIRNVGRPGISSMAISAIDASLWDLKARLLNVPLVKLLGAARGTVPIYGSGGFTSYSNDRLQEQLSGWASQGIHRVKMKIGSDPKSDLDRVRAARAAVGKKEELFVDANGAYDRKQALAQANAFAELGVCWFEEPVSSDDLEGLRLIRDRAPAGMEIAAGEYGYDLWYFHRMLESGAVDVLQADATRCAGITSFLQVAALCQARSLPFSAHCGPSLHVHPCCSAIPLRHLEYFHDHVRIEHMLFDGVLTPIDGELRPDLGRPGMGLEFKHRDAEQYCIWTSS